jgi:hypothetical protein
VPRGAIDIGRRATDGATVAVGQEEDEVAVALN